MKNLGQEMLEHKPTTFFELMEHDYSLYHTDYSKNITILELKIQEYSK